MTATLSPGDTTVLAEIVNSLNRTAAAKLTDVLDRKMTEISRLQVELGNTMKVPDGSRYWVHLLATVWECSTQDAIDIAVRRAFEHEARETREDIAVAAECGDLELIESAVSRLNRFPARRQPSPYSEARSPAFDAVLETV